VGQGAGLNSIGTVNPVTRNLISGNRNQGVVLTGAGTSNNLVRGNFIGTSAAGTAAVPNGQDGVWIGDRATNTTVGGTAAGHGNIISGNAWSGVALFHAGTTGNAVQGNYIGTTVGGDAPLGNGAGVWLAEGASGNVVGGSGAGERNVISANRAQGVMIRDA